MEGEVLRDVQWERLREFVPGGRKGKQGPRSDARRFFDAILWLARSGARLRDLPEDRFGPYQTVKRRYYRWIEQGMFDRIFEAVATEPDMEWLAIDATIATSSSAQCPDRRSISPSRPSPHGGGHPARAVYVLASSPPLALALSSGDISSA